MKKKQIIGLNTLLLVLLLGLFTTSYADINRIWTDTELKNVIFKMAMNKNANYESEYINLINSKETEITDIVNIINQYNYIYVGCYNNETLIIKISNTNTRNWYVYRNQATINTSYDSWYRVYRINLSSSQLTITYNTHDTTSWELNNYRYTSKNVYNSSTGTSLIWSAGTYSPSTFFDEWYYQDALPFTFIPKPADEYADVFYFEDIPLYNASGEDLYLGQLYQPNVSNVVYWTKDNYYYRYGDWNMRQLPVDSIYLEYFTSDENGFWYDVYLQSKYIYENTIYSTVLADGSSEPYTLAYTNFYIKNNYTSVVNGVINPSQTFSGDYKDKYDNDLDNQQDVNNIEQAINNTINDTENIDNTINQYLSGDAEHYANEFGFNDIEHSPLENPISTFLLDVVESVYDALTKRGNVSLDFNHHGTSNWIINTRDFITPESDVKNLIKISLVFMYIYGNYKYFHYLLTLVQTARIDKAIATLGTDEFYDTDIM